MKRLLTILLVVAVLAPFALVLTLALTPLWRWVEARYGLEAIGHSGPATWCFAVVYGSFLLSAATTAWVVRKLPAKPPGDVTPGASWRP